MATKPDTSTSLYAKYVGNPAQNYETYFVPDIGAPVGHRLAEAAKLTPGERVLDVACGTGFMSRLAAETVGPKGTVVGLDPMPAMLATARSASPERIEWHEAPAESMPLPDSSFDVVLCSMGVQFFGSKIQGLREMLRVLVPGGRVAIATPGPTPAFFQSIGAALAEHVGPDAAGFVEAVFSVHDPAGTRDLFTSAGFDDVKIETETIRLWVDTPEHFFWQYLESTPLAAVSANLDESKRIALERDVVERCKGFVEGDKSLLETELLIGTGRRPD